MDAENQPANQHDQPPGQEAEPAESANPTHRRRYDLLVLGGDSTAVRAAANARRLAARVALVQPSPPSEDRAALVRSTGHQLRQAARGIHQLADWQSFASETFEFAAVDFAALIHRAGEIHRRLAGAQSPGWLAAAGIDVYKGRAEFTGRDSLEVDGRVLRFHRAIIAAGARSAVAKIGPAEQPACLTSESLLELAELPAHLAVVGTLPDACRWAQTFARLGSEVHLMGHERTILPDEDPEAARRVQARLHNEGVRLHLGCDDLAIGRTGNLWAVVIEQDGRKEKLFVDHVLADAPGEPAVDELGLDAGGVAWTTRGIIVSDRLQTTNRRIFAAGEVCGSEFCCPQTAEAMARVCVHNALRYTRRKLSGLVIPRCVYTDPELAQLGLTAAEAASRRIEIDTYRAESSGVDRAVYEGREEGFVAVHVRRGSGRIVGATVVDPLASELIGPLALLMRGRQSLAAMADVVPCRPSRFEILRQLAEQYVQAPRPSRLALLAQRWRKRRHRKHER